jgi:hypothetical protein
MFTNKNSKCLISGLILAGTLGWSGAKVMASDDEVLSKTPLTVDNYCHLRFPAIRQSTLGTDHPQLKSPDSGDIVDFYGPCDHDPLGKDEIARQKDEDHLLRDHAYES